MTVYTFSVKRFCKSFQALSVIPERFGRDQIENHLAMCDTCLEIFLTAKDFWKDHMSETEAAPEKVDSSALETIYGRLKQFYEWITEPLTDGMLAEPLRSGLPPETDKLTRDYIKLFETSHDFHKDLVFCKTGDDTFSVNIRISEKKISKGILSVIMEREGGRFEARSLKDGPASSR